MDYGIVEAAGGISFQRQLLAPEEAGRIKINEGRSVSKLLAFYASYTRETTAQCNPPLLFILFFFLELASMQSGPPRLEFLVYLNQLHTFLVITRTIFHRFQV